MARLLVSLVALALVTSLARAADDPGLAGEPKDASRTAVTAFLKDLAAGKYDEAYARTTPEYQKAHPKEKWKQGFTKMAEKADLSKLAIDRAFASEGTSNREARAAAVTGLISAGERRKLGLGFGLVRQSGNWLIRDIDMLPNGNAVQNFIVLFLKVEPNAQEIPPSKLPEEERPVPREKTRMPSLP